MKKKKKKISYYEKKLWKAVSDFIRLRDSSGSVIGGTCISCGEFCEGKKAHAGHYYPNKACKFLTRYHPLNIHLQCMNCNMPRSRSVIEKVKCNYSLAMIDKYGKDFVVSLKELSEKDIKPKEQTYKDLTLLYIDGNTDKIIDYLLSLV